MTSVNISDLFNAYKKEQIAALPEGEYELEVASAKAKNETQITPTYTVLSGPYAGQKALCGQFTFSSENAASIAFQNLAGFGLDEAFFLQRPTTTDIAAALVGRRIRAFVEVRDWNNQQRNQFKIGAIQLISAAGPAVVTSAGIPPVAVAAPPVAAPPVAAVQEQPAAVVQEQPVPAAVPEPVAPAVAAPPPAVAAPPPPAAPAVAAPAVAAPAVAAPAVAAPPPPPPVPSF